MSVFTTSMDIESLLKALHHLGYELQSYNELYQRLKNTDLYYELPLASPSILGGVKVGNGLAITQDGTLSVVVNGLVPASELPTAHGVASVGTSTKYAREDHVHPEQTTISGNAGTATQFKDLQTVELTGDVIGSASSTAGWEVETTLKNSGVTAGSYGPSANASPAHKGTFSVPYITVDAKGRVTAASTKTITLPADNNTTYSVMTGASADAAGTSGLVPVPAQGDQSKVLSGAGTWVTNTGDTHWTTKLIAGASDSTANAATTNGNTTLRLFDNSSARSTIAIKGTGATTVASDANGVITISSTNTTYTPASATPLVAGTGTVGTSAKYAREDHVHPVQTSVSGNAGTATKFASAQSVALTGDVTGSASSQAGWSIATTLANTNVTAGSYGPSANASPGYGATFSVPYFTVDTKGRITAASTKTITLPASDNTDTHWTSHLYVGASNGSANAATTNGATYLMILDNSTVRDRRLIKGTGATTVTSDANGVITINSTDTNTVYTHPTTSGNKHIPSGGSSGQILRWSADGTAVWGNDNNTTYTFTNKAATLAWSTTSTIATVGGTDITVTMPANPNTNTWNALKGATSSANGTAGYAPAPPKDGYNTKYLRADGAWVVPPNTTYGGATTTANGLVTTGGQSWAGQKAFTGGINLYKSNLRMTVNKGSADTTDYTVDVLKALGDNAGYGINLALYGSGNTIVGGGESANSQLNDLKDNSGENLYLVADGSIYLKTNGNTWANAKTVTLGTDAHLSGLSKVTATTFVGALTGNVTGNCSGSSGSCTGNAATATTATKVNGTAGTSALAWNSEVTLYTIGGHAIKAKLPANPNTNTTYSAGTGLTLSGTTFSVTANTYAAYSHTHSYLPLSGGTLTGDVSITKANPVLYLRNSNKTRGTAPSAAVNVVEINGRDNANKNTWGIYQTYGTDRAMMTYLISYKGTTTDNAWAGIGIGYNGSGTVISSAPTPADNDNTTQIATTAWVQKYCNTTKKYLTSHQSLANYLTKLTNVLELGRYIDFHYDNETAKYDYDVRFQVNSQGKAAGGGVLQIVAASVKASKFEGPLTGNVTGNCSGTSANVTGTVAIANGGTGATTRLNAIKALTNENVGTNTTHFLGLKSDWSKVGYCSIADAKSVLGLGSAAYTASTAYAAASHTHSYLPLSGGTLTGNLTISGKQIICSTIRSGNDGGEVAIYGGASNIFGNAIKVHGPTSKRTDYGGADRYGSIEMQAGTASSNVTMWYSIGGLDIPGDVELKSATPMFSGILSDYTKNSTGQANQRSSGLRFRDKNNKTMGAFMILTEASSTATHMSIRHYPAAEETNYVGLHLNQVKMSCYPSPTKKLSLGWASYMWTTVYAQTSAINTSDLREKQAVDFVPDDILDAWGSVSYKVYKLNDSVEEKGIENARWHVGLIAQEIQTTCDSKDIDPTKYGFFCHDTWESETYNVNDLYTPSEKYAKSEEQEAAGDFALQDDFLYDVGEATASAPIYETNPAGDRYALRYEEALCIEAAYLRRENIRLKDRISLLEEKTTILEEKNTSLEERIQHLESIVAQLTQSA